MSKILRIGSVAYGEKYKDYLYDVAVPSLTHDIDLLGAEGWEVEHSVYENFMEMLRIETMNCEDRSAYFFMAPPDVIWSKWSLYNLAGMIEHLNCGISVPHFRVASDFRCLYPIESQDLLSQAMAQAHSTFLESFDTAPENQCHFGYSLRWVNRNILTMRHNIPSIAMIKLNQFDYEAFEEYAKHIDPVTQWDRAFINKLIIEGRFKIVGSSDMAFCVELTEEHLTNKPRENNYDDRHCYMFDTPADINRNTIYTMRLP